MRIPVIVIFCGEIDCDAIYSSDFQVQPQKIKPYESATKTLGTAFGAFFHEGCTKSISTVEGLQKLTRILNYSNAGEPSVD